jgi:hypothetical protein
MNERRARRLLPKLAKVGQVEGGRATIYWLRDTTQQDRYGHFDCQAYYERQEKRNARGLARDKARKAHTEANKPPEKVLQTA